MFDINEIKKDLYKSKNMAKFSHYQYGNLYYTIELIDGIYQFIIKVVEYEISEVVGMTMKLSSDLGTTTFSAEIRGSELIRWIQKSINTNELIKIC